MSETMLNTLAQDYLHPVVYRVAILAQNKYALLP